MKNLNIILYGSTGDLAKRKILPSLFNLYRRNKLPTNFTIFALSRRDWDSKKYQEYIEKAISKKFPSILTASQWSDFLKHINFHKLDVKDKKTHNQLREKLEKSDLKNSQTQYIFYLSISPDIYSDAFKSINNLNTEKKLENQKVIIEKPFGKDLNSFHKLNELILKSFKEKNIYRIDHYLGKETIRNLLYFRKNNPIISKNWNKESIEEIVINAFEDIGVEGRTNYYDNYGHLRDMVQSHLLQLTTLMLLPTNIKITKLKEEKIKILKTLQLDKPKEIYRGQYKAGVVNGKKAKGYKEEDGIDTNSNTETFVQIRLNSRLEKWKNLPITIQTGKRMNQKLTKIQIKFKKDKKGNCNSLEFILQPNAAIKFNMQVKQPNENVAETVPMTHEYNQYFNNLIPGAYENILIDAINSIKTTFISSKELEYSWKLIDKISKKCTNKLFTYPAGSSIDYIQTLLP